MPESCDAKCPKSLVATLAALLVSCSAETSLKPFSSDGCSLFPDGSLISEADWCSCCFDHDIAYWQGGTEAERLAADERLRDCVAGKTGSETLANTMFEGVRFGGSPYFYSWYRWGYGWGYSRKYQALTTAERTRAQALLEDYTREHGEQVCVR